MRYLVTGGAGFVGSHLCACLLSESHDVICVDNLRTGRRENLAELLGNDGFRLLELDIRDNLPLEGPVDCIFNLASPASPPHYQLDPLDTLLTNVEGTKHMLELARKCGARFVQASTSEVYGNPLEEPQSESYLGNVNPCGPRSCYDEGKRCAETLCYIYRERHGVDVRVARIFNTYGPHMSQDDGRVISNFVVQALLGKPLTVYGDGSQTRSFCYVSDTVRGLIALSRVDGPLFGPVNLGNPAEITVGELARRVIERIDPSLGVETHPLPADDPLRRRPDISLAKHKLGWEPTVGLDEGLTATISYFKEVLDA